VEAFWPDKAGIRVGFSSASQLRLLGRKNYWAGADDPE
jgi:hypothetical protein